MPIIDHERGLLVVRIVYDGPPFSGKTTTLRTLAEGLDVNVTTPAEDNGRTLFFDWLDYTGGLFEGRRIRCQIVSVPGQKELSARRDALLDSADAVVLVGGTDDSSLDAALTVFRDLIARCRAMSPPVGVVFQANKRDMPNTIRRASLQRRVNAVAPTAIVETVATTGQGIREAFVFGVRLALDRVRFLAKQNALATGRPAVDGPTELLAQLEAYGVADLPLPSPASDDPNTPADPPAEAHVPATPSTEQEEAYAATEDLSRAALCVAEQVRERVFTPDPHMLGGHIWPPVDGRTLLHEVAHLDVTPVRTADGDWWARAEGWRCHSAAGALFRHSEMGRKALIQWARLHATYVQRLSSGRALVLADAGAGRLRLWQLVRTVPTLETRLIQRAATASAEQLAAALGRAAHHLLTARTTLPAPGLRLSCTLSTVGLNHHNCAVYAGLMHQPATQASATEPSGIALLEREFLPLLREFKTGRSDFDVLAACLAQASKGHDDDVHTTLARIVGSVDWSSGAPAGRLR